MTETRGGAAPVSAKNDFDLALASTWPVAMFIGLVTIAVGVIVMVWPGETLTVLSVLFGIQLLLFGIFRLINAFSSETLAPGLTGFVGLLSMICGVVVIRHPFEAVAVLAVVLGVVWIVGGTIDVIGSMADHSLSDRGLAAVLGIISIIAGIVVVSWPAPTVTVVAWIAGIYLVGFGLLFCYSAFKLRQLEP